MLLLTALSGFGKVYSLWPYGRGKSSGGSGSGGGAGSVSEIPAILGAIPLWTEPVIINGVKTELGLNLLNTGLAKCVFQLRTLFPKAKFRANSGSLLLEIKLANGWRRRCYLVSLPGAIYPVIMFTMDVPDKFPKKDFWPRNLPLPSGAVATEAMQFPNRNSAYGGFYVKAPKAQVVKEMTGALGSRGWTAVTGEGTSSAGSGEFFYKNNPKSVCIMSLSEDGKGVTRGTLYTRPLE